MIFNALDLLCELEGFRSKPYQDSGGVWTIGFGTTYYPGGTPVRISDAPITLVQAKQFLSDNLRGFIHGASNLINININLTDNQFSALVIFAYNVGINALKNSTLLKKINKNPTDPTIEAEFMKWVYVKKARVAGLVKRRQAEADLYLKI